MLFLLLDVRLTDLYFVNAAEILLVSTVVLQKVKRCRFWKHSRLLYNHWQKFLNSSRGSLCCQVVVWPLSKFFFLTVHVKVILLLKLLSQHN